jgi:uncharacterized protein YodC (DUF2158 family)
MASETVAAPSMQDRLSPEFPVGAAVRLKSGGPDMSIDAVVEVCGEIRYRCVWVEGGATRIPVYTGDELESISALDD